MEDNVSKDKSKELNNKKEAANQDFLYHKGHIHNGNFHDHNINQDIHKQASQNLSFALVLNLLFNIVVITGGILTNSVAILSDFI